MNKNNLSWVDNKVFNNPGAAQMNSGQKTTPMRPYMGTMPAQYQEANQTGLSPATYQEPTKANQNQMELSPVYQEPAAKKPAAGLSPAAYQDSDPMDPAPRGLAAPLPGGGTQGTLTRTEAFDISPFNVEGPPTTMSPGYLPAYLKTLIGKRVRAEFVFQNLYLDKTGILREVGVNYFVLEDTATGAMVMCDLYSVKFVTSV